MSRFPDSGFEFSNKLIFLNNEDIYLRLNRTCVSKIIIILSTNETDSTLKHTQISEYVGNYCQRRLGNNENQP